MDNPPPSGSAGNSSDFVRKLYKMLEDPSYAQIVRWGDDRDSFVVLECEKFTKSILPKHFKHSNFASFVRQLNKYDFHKVRQNNEETGQSPYGPSAWEFKHPEFKADNKDSLDNIRRKAPAPRKQAPANDDSIPTQQLDLMNQQLLAQQQQLQHLADRFTQFTVDHQMMLQEVRRVQKSVLGHDQVVHCILTYLHSIDARQKRDSRAAAAASLSFQSQTDLSPSQVAGIDENPASPLQHATKLLNEMTAENQFNFSALEGIVPTPPLDQQAAAAVQQRANAAAAAAAAVNGVNGVNVVGGVVGLPPSSAAAAQQASLSYPKMNGELEQVVYPVGATNGIDPMYSEHVNNIPYSLPTSASANRDMDVPDVRRQYPVTNDGRKKSIYPDPAWARSPHILLVEDDQTCRQIGGKFLYSFSCVVDTALDGLEAVNKIQGGLIRRFDSTPIIAMTSNIRSSDIDLYFHHGMNDVLPKPFTRQSLLNMLEKHLVSLKNVSPMDASQQQQQQQQQQPPPSSNTPPTAQPPGQGNNTNPNTGPGPSPLSNSISVPVNVPVNVPVAGLPPTSQAVKDESSPTHSPSTMGQQTWQNSPLTPGPGQSFDTNGLQYQNQQQNQPQNQNQNQAQNQNHIKHRRQASDMAGIDLNVNAYNKRQRIFHASGPGSGPGPGAPVVNPMQTSRMA
ncbi:transcription factor SKN7 [Nannizzia gypsea CBS 118893]|uniref:Transcription factor n=1 Tax=Arthroderma gypseum (strain ATCC MYA-4604 / CBS 118893) TaxID=535722 RepID=E5QZK7_ARTGP|nr:transcription factor SKN7 [Nannizzia gypsea CBS 118893]EFQ97373.1 transcription factor SKN7 [Nannizzia gypsea CBS 118893]